MWAVERGKGNQCGSRRQSVRLKSARSTHAVTLNNARMPIRQRFQNVRVRGRSHAAFTAASSTANMPEPDQSAPTAATVPSVRR